MSDGYWNGSSPNVGNQDSGVGAPYQDGFSNTLADVAWRYYDTDLAAGLANELATNNYDSKTSQHMVTYAISFGLDGVLDTFDLDGNGIPDNPSCIDDPYFLDPSTPTPNWPQPCSSCVKNIDDMWHAAVNGHGEFFSAKNPDDLVDSLTDLFSNIASRAASGASVAVNGDELKSDIVLYQSSYDPASWNGDVIAYPINVKTGEILKEASDIIWQAKEKLQLQDWDNGRKIITYNGTNGVPFRYTDLSDNQKTALLHNPELVEYLRGNEITGFRSRTRKLGDIVHSAPLLVSAVNPENDGVDNDGNGMVDEMGEKGGHIFSGGNDGMLHAINVVTGNESFSYMPHHIFYNLQELADIDYQHKFFVDGKQYFKRLQFLAGDNSDDGVDNDNDGCFDNDKQVIDPYVFCDESTNGHLNENFSDSIDNDGDGETDEAWETKTFTMLTGSFNKGGKGIYALNISEPLNIDPTTKTANDTEAVLQDIIMWEYPDVPVFQYKGNQTADGIDNDGDATIDEADEDYSDTIDNNNDGHLDEEGELSYEGMDDDLGYTFSTPYIVRLYTTTNEEYNQADSPWAVIFANGYESVNNHAVLYILDAFTGNLIRKIDTGVGGNNGLSRPALVDVDNDDRIDFAYAGDLKGNLWKFDLRDQDPNNWDVAFYDGVTPKPFFSVPGKPITAEPDIMFHPQHSDNGNLVIFATGKYLGEDDRSDLSQQAIYGVWDYGETSSDYLGDWDSSNNSVSNLTGVKLLEQTEIDFRFYAPGNTYLRTISDNTTQWYLACSDGVDNDGDGYIDDSDHENDDGHPESCVPVSPGDFVNDEGKSYKNDGVDNDYDEEIDEIGEELGHVGWVFKLPFGLHYDSDGQDNDNDGTIDEVDEAKLVGERVIKDIIIRDGRAVVISFIPDESPCSGGGNSIVHEFDAKDGGRVTHAVFDINLDGLIDENDYITVYIDGVATQVAPTGRMYEGILHSPVIVGDPDDDNDREMKIFSSSSGNTDILWEKKEGVGIYYWREY